ncbi:MAG TPA: hypothetical protein VGB14_05805 [Acidimicrobiales bacterium]
MTTGAAALAGVAAGLPAVAGAATGARWTSRATWEPLVGTPVTVWTEGRAVRLRLAAVRDLRGRSSTAAPLAARDDAFVLVFDGDADADLAGGVYRVHAGRAGAFDALVVPTRTRAGTTRHALVVNRA